MPYEVKKQGKQWCVYKQGTNKKFGCHGSEKEANDQLRALYANEKAELEVRYERKRAEA
jgi:hypothetical protein